MKLKQKFIVPIIVFMVLCAAPSVFGQAADNRFDFGNEDQFSLSLAVDIPLAATGAGLFITELLLDPLEGTQKPLDDIIFPDKYAIFPYNSALDITGDVLFYSSLLLTLPSLIGQDFGTIAGVGAMFAESMLLTIATKDLLKDLIPRYRPYSYDSIPEGDDDYMNSFPSGHTAMVFAVCSFSAYVFAELYPESPWKLPVGIGACSIAAATAVMRVVSGNHFITDVLAGALIGTVYGIGVPLLHQIQSDGTAGRSASLSSSDIPLATLSVRL